MEQTVEDHHKRNFVVGLGVISMIIILSFFLVYYIVNSASNIPERDLYYLPEWVKSNAGWWSEGHISDSEFSNTLQWLFDHGFVEVKKCVGSCLDESE